MKPASHYYKLGKDSASACDALSQPARILAYSRRLRGVSKDLEAYSDHDAVFIDDEGYTEHFNTSSRAYLLGLKRELRRRIYEISTTCHARAVRVLAREGKIEFIEVG